MFSKKYLNNKSFILLKSTIPRSDYYFKNLFASNSSASNSSSDYIDERENHQPIYNKKEKLIKNKIIKQTAFQKFKEILEFKPGNVPPTNLGVIDKKGGFVQLDVDIPLNVLLEDSPKILKKEAKKLSTHFRQKFYLVDHANLLRTQSDTAHTETFIQYEFRNDEDFEYWQTGSDSDWSEGYSKCDFYKTDRGTAIFEGYLSQKVVKDGRTECAGWCSIKTIDMMSLNLKKRYEEWGYYSHLLIKCRGDGRSYKIMLHSPESWDITWGDTHSYPLHTHGGPYWQFEMIPFSRFFYTFGGRIMDRQLKFYQNCASSIGITLMDNLEGPFRLEIDFIGVTNDRTHTEELAYETFNTPFT
uniref:NADH:ubiquinone oxidoreductase intermediate-associated protein 30 domain-containing protein n=1 Tax=Meloidogyne incognita TaxID=6306 RepID=A0A914N1J0_MELIC